MISESSLFYFFTTVNIFIWATAAGSSHDIDICTEEHKFLCGRGRLISVVNISCGSGRQTCPYLARRTLQSLCHGQQTCTTFGLQQMFQEQCRNNPGFKRSLRVEFDCLPGTNSSCQANICAANSDGLGCPGGSKIHVRGISCFNLTDRCPDGVHTSISLCEGVPRCDASGLKDLLSQYCQHQDMAKRNVFVNYVCVRGKTNAPFRPEDLQTCAAPPVVRPPKRPLPPRTYPQTPSSIPVSISRNFGPAEGMFDYRDSSYQPDGSDSENEGSSSLSKQLKLMILYIFFGVVILVLLVALIAVIVSYRRISKFKGSHGDSSEKTALWQHHEDTPLDTFHHNTRVESSGSPTSETIYAFKSGHDMNQVIATVHRDAISENDDFDPRISSGSGISTFLSGKGDSDFRDLINSFQTDSFPLYSSVDDNRNNDTHHQRNSEAGYYELTDTDPYSLPGNGDINNIYEVIDRDHYKGGKGTGVNSPLSSAACGDTGIPRDEHHIVFNHDQQPLVDSHPSPPDDLHYHVNNDEYAVVRKSRKLVKPYV